MHRPTPEQVVDWRLRDLSADDREDLEERAAIIADGCKVSQDEGLTRALRMLREKKDR